MEGREGAVVTDLFLKALYRRALGDRQGLLPVWFEASVLERYRGDPAFQLVRTDSAGRLKQEGAFSLDFGIPPGEALIHVGLEAFLRLPERERTHWIDHLVSLPLSVTFVQMQMSPGNCFDDGEIRPY